MAYEASGETQKATCQSARCFDPRWPPESQHGSTAPPSQRLDSQTVSVPAASDIYTICLGATFTSFFFLSVAATPSICHLVPVLFKPLTRQQCLWDDSNRPPQIRILFIKCQFGRSTLRRRSAVHGSFLPLGRLFVTQVGPEGQS